MMPDVPPPFDAAWARFVIGFILGGVLGSFATMLAYRLPRKISIVFPRSHCPLCKTVLGMPDLVPVFSWLFLKGRCRHCHAKIGVRYVTQELAVSLGCASATVVLGFSPLLIGAYAIIVATVVYVFIKRQS